MPLTPIQRAVIAAIRPNRSPHSHVAGATVLNRSGPRYSLDIDLFQDTADDLNKAVSADLASLHAEGFAVKIESSSRDAWRVLVTKDGEEVTVDWMIEESVRFFPAVADEDLGYRLHDVDAVVNKLIAAVLPATSGSERCFRLAVCTSGFDPSGCGGVGGSFKASTEGPCTLRGPQTRTGRSAG